MAGDPLWPYVVVSFDPQGANGAALSQTDNKGNAFSAQAGSPVFSTTWAAVGGSSAWFNGSARAQCANNAGLNFRTGDFEVSLWLYQTARTSPWAAVIGFGQDSPSTQGWRVLIGPTGQLSFNLHTGPSLSSVSTTLIPLNTATHVAIGRSNGVEFMYVNGVAVATTGTLGSIASFGGVLQLSGTIGANWLYTGFIDRLEIIKGVARHTAAFTPETSAFLTYAGQVSGTVRDDAGALCARTVRAYHRASGALVAQSYTQQGDSNIADVALLLQCAGDNRSTTFVDKSLSPKTVTVTGDTHISTVRSKFGMSSGVCDGSGDWLSLGTGAVSIPGDYTFEAWVYLNTMPSYVFALFDTRTTGAQASFTANITASGALSTYLHPTATNGTAGAISAGQWYHIAYSRSGNTLRGFVNGVLNLTATHTAPGNGGSALRMFANVDGDYSLDGYFEQVRVSVGVARYTANFTPPADRFPENNLSLGNYSFNLPTPDEHEITYLDDAAGNLYNDIINRVIPA